MRRPRVGFRVFLLITTLVSLVAATFAIRSRTDSSRTAGEHALLAQRLRARLAWEDAHIRDAGLTLERKAPPAVSQQWAALCDLRFLSPVRSEEELPAGGRNLIDVGDNYGVLRIRVFDAEDRRVVDIAEGYSANAVHDQRVKDLRRRLADLAPPHDLTGAEKAEIIAEATSIVNSCRAILLARGKIVDSENKARRARDVAEAERHERLARSIGP